MARVYHRQESWPPVRTHCCPGVLSCLAEKGSMARCPHREVILGSSLHPAGPSRLSTRSYLTHPNLASICLDCFLIKCFLGSLFSPLRFPRYAVYRTMAETLKTTDLIKPLPLVEPIVLHPTTHSLARRTGIFHNSVFYNNYVGVFLLCAPEDEDSVSSSSFRASCL